MIVEHEGPAQQAILDFVRATTGQANPKFVPPEERIATFNPDGTLWIEYPAYSQVIDRLDRVPAVVEKEHSRTSSHSRRFSRATARQRFRCMTSRKISRP